MKYVSISLIMSTLVVCSALQASSSDECAPVEVLKPYFPAPLSPWAQLTLRDLNATVKWEAGLQAVPRAIKRDIEKVEDKRDAALDRLHQQFSGESKRLKRLKTGMSPRMYKIARRDLIDRYYKIKDGITQLTLPELINLRQELEANQLTADELNLIRRNEQWRQKQILLRQDLKASSPA